MKTCLGSVVGNNHYREPQQKMKNTPEKRLLPWSGNGFTSNGGVLGVGAWVRSGSGEGRRREGAEPGGEGGGGTNEEQSSPPPPTMNAKANAVKLKQNRVKPETAKGYISKLKEVAVYFQSADYDGPAVTIVDGIPETPIPLEALTQFIGHKTLEQEDDEEDGDADGDADGSDADDDAAVPKKRKKRPEGGLYTPNHVNAYKVGYVLFFLLLHPTSSV